MKELMDQLVAAHAVSTPLAAVTSPDQFAVAYEIKAALNGSTPIISWDRARGLRSFNQQGSSALQYIVDQLLAKKLADEGFSVNDLPPMTRECPSAMGVLQFAPPHTIVLAFSIDRFFRCENEGTTIQAILNLRQDFKRDGRMLIMLSPDFSLPVELQHDVLLLDDPLPTNEGYENIVKSLHKLAKLKAPSDTAPIVRAVRGLSSFEAEQVLSMSLAMSAGKEVSLEQAWKLKQGAVEKIKGLKLEFGNPNTPDIKDLRGLNSIIDDLDALWNGPEPPELVIRVDEMDKSFAGLGSNGGPGDNTGVTQDLNQTFLTNMEGNGWNGYILAGARGSGKTALTECIGKAHGVPTLSMDTGAMMQKHVGESQQNFREAFRTAKSIGGRRVIVLATCNRLDVLPPELLRRFKMGIVFFDLLSKEERESLWPVYLKKYGHDLNTKLPNDEGWSGSDIRNCCEIAYLTRKPIEEIGKYNIVPVSKADPASIKRMRAQAHGTFLSASYKGVYQNPDNVAAQVLDEPSRQLALGGK